MIFIGIKFPINYRDVRNRADDMTKKMEQKYFKSFMRLEMSAVGGTKVFHAENLTYYRLLLF